MKFPLADWIDAHPGMRHDLARSGMRGAIRRPAPTAAEVRGADAEHLRSEIGRSLDVAAERVFLTHGGNESNAWVLWYLTRTLARRSGSCRVAVPEYPALTDGAHAAGYEVTVRDGPTDLAAVSQPRNPEGDEWSPQRLFDWSAGARHLLVDETFRDFGTRRSFATADRPRLWTTGSFTKFYAGDDLRVGFVVAPEAESRPFGRFVGLFADEIPPTSVAGALTVLRHRPRLREEIDGILATNRRALTRALGLPTGPVAPVFFDRTGPRSTELAQQLLAASVLVCPGALFGDPNGIRVCLTRRSFPADLAAYLSVRGPEGTPGVTRDRRPARRPRAGPARARAGPA